MRYKLYLNEIEVRIEIRAAADEATLLVTLRGEKGGELSENKNRAAKWQNCPRHTLIVAGRVKKSCLRRSLILYTPYDKVYTLQR